MDRTEIEQEFLIYCIKKGKGKLPIALDLLELITSFIEDDRQKQLPINGVVGQSEQLCDFEHHNADIRRGYTCTECGGRKLR